MIKILQIVEQLMQIHVKGVKDLGIDLEKEIEKAKKTQTAGSHAPIEDLIRK